MQNLDVIPRSETVVTTLPAVKFRHQVNCPYQPQPGDNIGCTTQQQGVLKALYYTGEMFWLTVHSTPDPTRGNRKSPFPEFQGESTPNVDPDYLRGSALEPFLFTIATSKI